MRTFEPRTLHHILITSAALAICEAGTASAEPAGNKTADEAAAAAPQIQEVIVTAQRRETNLLQTPVAVSAVSGKTMEVRHLQTLEDLTTQIPDVQFAQSNTNTYITVRGIGNGTSLQGSDPGVAFYLDGVYLAATGLAGGAFLDVDHVEVLRGPQGTLFGRDATGGAVNVISRTPTSDFGGELGGWVGVAPAQVHTDGYLSGPLNASGTLLGRISARQDYNEGYTKNLGPNGPNRLDDQNSVATRGQLEWRPSADITAGVTVDYESARDNGQAAFLLGAPAVVGGMSTSFSPTVVAAQDAAKMHQASALPGDLATREAEANQGEFDASFLGVRANLDWRLGQGTLKAVGAYDRVQENTLADGDGTSADFTSTDYAEHSHQEYGELLYTSEKVGRLEYLFGANIFHQISSELVTVPINSLGLAVVEPSVLSTYSVATFAHADVDLTKRINMFGGLRYTYDDKNITEANNFINKGTPLTHSDHWERVTYEIGAKYQLLADTDVYAKYSTGFKSGGFSAAALTPPFNPETNGSAEIGLRGLYFDRRLQAELTGFLMNYDNLQVNQVIGAVAEITNAAKARIDGVETSFVALFTQDLRGEASATFLDAKFTKFDEADSARPALGIINLSGNALPWSPRWSFSVGMYYRLPIDVPGNLTAGARYYWKDKTYFTEFNLPVASQNAVGRADLSLNYVSADKLWEASVFARNVTDAVVVQRARVVSALLNSASLAQLDAGRDIGLSLRRHF